VRHPDLFNLGENRPIRSFQVKTPLSSARFEPLQLMSIHSEGDAEEHTPDEGDEYDYDNTPFSSRCRGCGIYSAELTSKEKLGFCQKCGGLLRPLHPGEGGKASPRRKKFKPQASSSGCMLIVVAFALIILLGSSRAMGSGRTPKLGVTRFEYLRRFLLHPKPGYGLTPLAEWFISGSI
jgi:hypothetical protein